MQSRFENGIHHLVCGASGASECRFYGGEDPNRKMDWVGYKVQGFVIVSLTKTKMTLEFISNKENLGYPVVHTIVKEKQ
jgi:hypothetical protein